MAIIQTSRLYKDYATNGVTVKALRGIDLTIDTGEFSALAGPSGSGKTTLLNIIGGLDHPTKGQVTVNDILLNDQPARELARIRLNRIGFILGLQPHPRAYRLRERGVHTAPAGS
jgi:putative ABC transport system ATP-binding protein